MTLELASLSTLRTTIATWRGEGKRIALVPTMGALHRGHLTLVERAKEMADRVIVSIFVNPTQFGPNEDFTRYPRPLEKDLALLRDVGADAAWLPSVEEMYPQGYATNVRVTGVSEPLEGASRPGHFDGVATVVSKLLLQVMPDVALFGEKDYQQLCVIRRMVADLNIPVEIHGVPTVREVSGLALSSRNQYLSDAERTIAPKLYVVMQEVAVQVSVAHVTDSVSMLLDQAKSKLRGMGFTKIDYLELRDADTLAPVSPTTRHARLLAAVWLGKTRLIDNIAVELAC